MRSSSKPTPRAKRVRRGPSTDRVAPARPRPRARKQKQSDADEGERDVGLSREDAAELEALTAPLRRYAGAAARDSGEPDRKARGRTASAAGAQGEASGGRRDQRERGRKSAQERTAEGGERGRGRSGRGSAREAAEGGERGRGRSARGSQRERAAEGGERERVPLRPARSSLAQKGGPVVVRGDEALTAQLAAALAAADSDETNDLTHGFHTYPARMHPRLARELVAHFSTSGEVVLDPFCGSGTVLVEALVAGRKPQGVDLNPLALRISEIYCQLRDPRARRRFQRHLRLVADASEERVRSRARAHIPIDREVQAFYQPHVLFELCGLREEIDAVADEADRRALLIVFSSLLIKFSRKRADTSPDVVDKRLRKGLVTEFFERKGQELNMRWEALFDAAPNDAFEARLLCGDARELPRLLGSSFQADLIVSSPPYGGTYDYARQHQLRNAWLGLDAERLQEREIGARSALSHSPNAAGRWDDELLATLRAMREVVSDRARIILWLGDAEIAGRRISADQQVADLASDAALTLKASASQARLDARGGADRSEHLLLLETQPFRR